MIQKQELFMLFGINVDPDFVQNFYSSAGFLFQKTATFQCVLSLSTDEAKTSNSSSFFTMELLVCP